MTIEDYNEKDQGQNEFQLGRDVEGDKRLLCKGIEIGGRQWKLYKTELMENERTDITIEKRLEHSLVFML